MEIPVDLSEEEIKILISALGLVMEVSVSRSCGIIKEVEEICLKLESYLDDF